MSGERMTVTVELRVYAMCDVDVRWDGDEAIIEDIRIENRGSFAPRITVEPSALTEDEYASIDAAADKKSGAS